MGTLCHTEASPGDRSVSHNEQVWYTSQAVRHVGGIQVGISQCGPEPGADQLCVMMMLLSHQKEILYKGSWHVFPGGLEGEGEGEGGLLSPGNFKKHTHTLLIPLQSATHRIPYNSVFPIKEAGGNSGRPTARWQDGRLSGVGGGSLGEALALLPHSLFELIPAITLTERWEDPFKSFPFALPPSRRCAFLWAQRFLLVVAALYVCGGAVCL